MNRFVILCSLLCLLTLGARAQNAAEREVRQALDALNQASARGDKAAVERLLADSYVGVDPDGQVLPKAKLLADWQTLPASVKRTAELADVRVTLYGEVAVAVYRVKFRQVAGEQTNDFHARVTHVLRRQQTQWRFVAEHVSAIPQAPPVAKVDGALLDGYVGDYEISAGFVVRVQRAGDKLLASPPNMTTQDELLAENATTFFIQGQSMRLVFVRDAQGQVTHAIARFPDGQEIKARKIK